MKVPKYNELIKICLPNLKNPTNEFLKTFNSYLCLTVFIIWAFSSVVCCALSIVELFWISKSTGFSIGIGVNMKKLEHLQNQLLEIVDKGKLHNKLSKKNFCYHLSFCIYSEASWSIPGLPQSRAKISNARWINTHSILHCGFYYTPCLLSNKWKFRHVFQLASYDIGIQYFLLLHQRFLSTLLPDQKANGRSSITQQKIKRSVFILFCIHRVSNSFVWGICEVLLKSKSNFIWFQNLQFRIRCKYRNHNFTIGSSCYPGLQFWWSMTSKAKD